MGSRPRYGWGSPSADEEYWVHSLPGGPPPVRDKTGGQSGLHRGRPFRRRRRRLGLRRTRRMMSVMMVVGGPGQGPGRGRGRRGGRVPLGGVGGGWPVSLM